jgi:membrane protein involved in colicin uptake
LKKRSNKIKGKIRIIDCETIDQYEKNRQEKKIQDAEKKRQKEEKKKAVAEKKRNEEAGKAFRETDRKANAEAKKLNGIQGCGARE